MKQSNFPGRREQKRAIASQNLSGWQSLTIEAQLEDLRKRPGTCTRQIARLVKLSAKGHTYATKQSAHTAQSSK